MIVVSGTKRSGTSMWMQALEAGGFLVLGTRFMKNWEATIKDANPHGFYESVLRRGIYFATNPHPETGIYLPPRDTRRVAVKVFPPGLARTDMAFLDHVIVTMRPWREYVTSLQRLYAMEDAARARRREERAPGTEQKPRPRACRRTSSGGSTTTCSCATSRRASIPRGSRPTLACCVSRSRSSQRCFASSVGEMFMRRWRRSNPRRARRGLGRRRRPRGGPRGGVRRALRDGRRGAPAHA